MLVFTAVPVTVLAIWQISTENISQQTLFGAALSTHGFAGGVAALPTAVFTGEGRFCYYMLFLFLMGIGLIGSFHPNRSKFIIFSMVTCFIGAVVAGRRLNLFLLLISPLLIFFMDKLPLFTESSIYKKKNILSNKLPVIIIMLFLSCSAVFYFAVQSFFKGNQLNSTLQFYMASVDETKSQVSRRYKGESGQLGYSLKKAKIVMGNGTGSNTQGMEYLVKDYEAGVEGGIPKIIWELGILGLFIYCWLAIKLFFTEYNLILRCRHNPLYFFGVAVIVYQITFVAQSIKGHQYMDDAFQQIYLWFTTGVLFSIPRIIYYEKHGA